jgi:hypothetical protein
MHPVQGLQNLHFGGGVAGSTVHPAILLLVLIAGVLLCVWPRRRALVLFLTLGLLIPTDQILVVGGAHFPMLRLLALFGFVRMIRERIASKAAIFSGGFNRIDLCVVLYSILVAINGVLLFQEIGAVVNQIGVLYTVFGVYFLMRSLIRKEEEIVLAIQTLVGVATVIAATMSYETITGHSPYALLGGADAHVYANLLERDGRFRAQGPFAHSILAGTFGAILVPLFIALWWKGKANRKWVVAGIIACTVMTLACASSTPILAYAAGVFALCLWPLRKWMRAFRWGIVIVLVTLHIVLKNPVWHLMVRIDLAGGSSGYHRFMLVDQCIRHFSDWWLMGVKDTSVWGWDMWDTANQYVGTADNSGLLPFSFFIAIIVFGFKYIGKAWRGAAKSGNKNSALFAWALGTGLFANGVAFLGISYFDQSIVGWYALLAMISAAYMAHRSGVRAETPQVQFVAAAAVPEFAGAALADSFASPPTVSSRVAQIAASALEKTAQQREDESQNPNVSGEATIAAHRHFTSL